MAERKVNVDRSLVAVPRARQYRRRHRFMARDVGTGILYTAGAGAVVALLANLDDIRNSKEAKEHWWLLPLGLIGLGYMLRKNRSAHAGAVIAVGGAMFALAYMAQQKAAQAQQQQQQQQQPPAPKPGAPQQLVFAGDTGAPLAMLPGIWLQSSNGSITHLPLVSRRTAQYTT